MVELLYNESDDRQKIKFVKNPILLLSKIICYNYGKKKVLIIYSSLIKDND